MPKFFLSYRRADAGGEVLAHMIFRDLRHRYGSDAAFLDVDTRRPGLSFPSKVRTALDSSDAVLVIIGPEWVKCLQERALDERDWVRYEVAESLKREGLPVVPVCHSKAQMPSARDLPDELKGLADRDGVSLDPFADFDAHISRLLEDLETVIRERSLGAVPDPPSDQAPANPSEAPPPTLEDPRATSERSETSSRGEPDLIERAGYVIGRELERLVNSGSLLLTFAGTVAGLWFVYSMMTKPTPDLREREPVAASAAASTVSVAPSAMRPPITPAPLEVPVQAEPEAANPVYRYYVQAGSFPTRDFAGGLRTNLLAANIGPVFIVYPRHSGVGFPTESYRVVVGPFDSLKEALIRQERSCPIAWCRSTARTG
jgi:hypothetical protein